MAGAKLVCGKPSQFSKDEKQLFIDLVCSGGEVAKHTLRRNVPLAECLVFLRSANELCGVAALKIPIPSYRQTLRSKAGVTVDEAAFPYELGYIFVPEQARGKGFSSELAGAAADASGDRGIFATSRLDNEPMHRTLAKHGFEKAGQPYQGKDAAERIQLFLRQALKLPLT